jgi:hypothetical protein
MIAIVSAVFVIRSKVNKIHDTVENHISAIVNLAEKGGELSALASSKVIGKATKAILNKKKR